MLLKLGHRGTEAQYRNTTDSIKKTFLKANNERSETHRQGSGTTMHQNKSRTYKTVKRGRGEVMKTNDVLKRRCFLCPGGCVH